MTKKGRGAGTPIDHFSTENKRFEPWLGDAEDEVAVKEQTK